MNVHQDYGYTLEGITTRVGGEDTIFDSIFGGLERGVNDAGNILGRFFGNVTGSFSNSVGEAVGLPSFLIPTTVLVIGSGAAILLIYLLIKK
jgi:hypothetical protein